MFKKILLSMTMFLCLTASYVFGANYYIDYNGGKDINDGASQNTAWKLCPGMKGFTGAYTPTPGDVFVFKGSVVWPKEVFPFEIKNGGDVQGTNRYIGGQNFFPKYGDGYPIFDGGSRGIYTTGVIYKKSGVNYITIDGIEVINAGNISNGSGVGIFFAGGSFVEVKNCRLFTNGVNAFAYSVSIGNHESIYFHNNIIRKSGRVHFNCSGLETKVRNVKYFNNIHYGGFDYDNHSYHCDGLMIGGSGLDDYTLEDVYIYNNVWRGKWSKAATAQLYLNGLSYYSYNYSPSQYSPTVGQVLVGKTSKASGKIYQGSGSNVLKLSSGAFKVGEEVYEAASYGGQFIGVITSPAVYECRKSIKNGYIINNLFVAEQAEGGKISPSPMDIALGNKDLHVYNNTVDMGYPTNFYGATALWILRDADTVDIINNIFAGVTNYGVVMEQNGVSNVMLDYNLYEVATGLNLIYVNKTNKHPDSIEACKTLGWEEHGIEAEPLFVRDPDGTEDSGDFNLMSTSPALGKGKDLSSIFKLYKNGVLQQNWNIGCSPFDSGYEVVLDSSIAK